MRDPEVRQLPDGRAVCTVRLAVEGMDRGNETGYIDVTEFGPAAAASACLRSCVLGLVPGL